MVEEVLFESESVQSRAEVAEYLRAVADNLDAGEPVTLRAGGETVTLDPPTSMTFEAKAEREGPADEAGELSLEFELEWADGKTGGATGLEIE